MKRILTTKKNLSYILAYILISTLLLFTLAGCDTTKPSVEPTDSFITMTTDAQYVYLDIRALGEVTIDWGDDGGETTIITQLGMIRYGHAYLNSEIRTITIYGDIIHLDCSRNELTELNIKNSRHLRSLNCRHNLLSSLDISENKYLTELNATSNKLEHIDLANNKKLRVLFCGFNNLTRLDASSNIELLDLVCSGNMIAHLDIKNSPYLRYLNADNNQLDHINVSLNPALTVLSVSGNEITCIDISHNISLNTLYARSNRIKSVVLGNNLSLRYMILPFNQLDGDAINNIFHGLPDHSNHNIENWITISANPGVNDCDISIARRKGWTVFR